MSALVVIAALIATGCGDAEPTQLLETGEPAADTSTDGSTVAATTPPPGANEISTSIAAHGMDVKISAITPKRFVKAHCSKPILVVLYQPESIVDEDVLAEARAAAAQVKGTTTLVYTPKQHKAYGDLAAKLGLLASPGVATVSRAGKIENFWTTYVDRALILESLRNAAAAKPCKVGSDDVPAAGTSALADASALVAGTAPAATATTDTGSTAVGTATPGTGAGTAVPSGIPGSGAVDDAQAIADAESQGVAVPGSM